MIPAPPAAAPAPADDSREYTLGKTLSYFLRHSGKKEPINFYAGGYVLVDDLLGFPQFKRWTSQDILEVVASSASKIDRKTKRFERVDFGGQVYIRACYAHTFKVDAYPSLESVLQCSSSSAQTPPHTNVASLLQLCLRNISEHIKAYTSLEALWDAHLLQLLLERLKRDGRLSNATLRLFLTATMEVMDLEGVFLSDGAFQKLLRSCTGLSALSLAGNFALITPNNLQLVAKKLPKLTQLNLSDGRYLNDQSISHLGLLKNLQMLDLNNCFNLTDAAMQTLSTRCPKLADLSLERCTKITDAGMRHIAALPLVKLNLSWCTLLGDPTLQSLAQHCSTLVRLSVRALFNLTESGVESFLERSSQLRLLDVRSCEKITLPFKEFLTVSNPSITIVFGIVKEPTVAKEH